MATTYTSGAAVPSGYYLNASRWAIEPVEKDGMRLPEGKGTWMRIPTVGALLLTPILGATFLMFLPFVGFVLALRALANPVVRLFTGSAGALAATMSGAWAPGEAHFTGKAGEPVAPDEKAAPAPGDEKLDALEEEIAAKRAAPK